MSHARVVVACEPTSYRQVVAAMLSTVRPGLEIVAAEPDDLGHAIAIYNPHLTICSRLDELTRTHLFAWMLLYPDGASYAEVSIAGHQSLFPGVDLSQLLAVVDEVAQLAAVAPHT